MISASASAQQLNTTINDFFLNGSQPNHPTNPIELDAFIAAKDNCIQCHANFTSNTDAEPFRHWAGSMMAQAVRDPLFQAALTIANQDAAFSGDLCLRCHAPAAWLSGRSVPTDGSALTETVDFEGVTCHFCHRLVDPVFVPGTSPPPDESIIADLIAQGVLPAHSGSAQYVVDPSASVRRGPRDGINHPQGATAIESPFHTRSALCGTCHDVSNPAFELQPDGTYQLTTLGAAHPTGDQYDMFPIERTYSEWLMSDFATGGVILNGRFGGNLPPTTPIESCQDCHMSDQTGPGCNQGSGVVRNDAPQHAFNGANIWVLDAVRALYPDSETGLSDDIVAGSHARAAQMLTDASDMTAEQQGSDLKIRITNYTGHKLPSGYPEGRRMWVNVKFRDAGSALLTEHGAYDGATGVLDTASTTVYEAKLGVDAAVSAATGVPVGESFHFVLNNVIIKDNRIPPIGFTNANFEAIQAAPVGETYADGQHWHDSCFPLPAGAVEAEVTVYYQTTSKEYVDFLLAENTTDSTGLTLYNQWVAQGRSAPVVMDQVTIPLTRPGDTNGDGIVGIVDLLAVLGSWGYCPDCPEDVNGDDVVDILDLLLVLANWG